jgi:hypothetical protein
MHKLSLVSLFAGALLIGASQASAATPLDTIQSESFCLTCSKDTPSALFKTPKAYQSLGLRFTSAAPAIVTNVEAYIGSQHGGSVQIGIMSDSSGVPSGTFLSGEGKVVKVGTTSVNLYSLNWSIGAGSDWLVAIATSGTNAAWQINPGGLCPFCIHKSHGVTWEATGDSDPYAARIISGFPNLRKLPICPAVTQKCPLTICFSLC